MPNLTDRDIDGVYLLYPVEFFEKDQTWRMLHLENRVLLFTSEPLPNRTEEPDAHREVVRRFLVACAHHSLAEDRGDFSPAHTGYTVRNWRQTGVRYLMDRADRLEAKAPEMFTLYGEMDVFTNCMK